jgi:D-alanyl-D-alanine carboxypeptidase
VTKTFTVALILQLVEEGRVDLEAKASEYVRGIAHSDEYTVRHLIQHTSGLIATDGVGPGDALLAATRESLLFEPGTSFTYSSPGYFMLGLIIEHVTGMSYTEALHERLLDPLHLDHTQMDEELSPLDYSTHPTANPALRSSSGVLRSSSGAHVDEFAFEYYGVLWSSAGIQSTAADLAAWGIALWGSDAVLDEATRAQMTTFLGPEYQYAGLGTYPFCPCWRDADGKLQGERWGHYGRSGVLEYDPAGRVAVAIYTNGTDIDERLIVAYDDLSNRLRAALYGRAFAGG